MELTSKNNPDESKDANHSKAADKESVLSDATAPKGLQQGSEVIELYLTGIVGLKLNYSKEALMVHLASFTGLHDLPTLKGISEHSRSDIYEIISDLNPAKANVGHYFAVRNILPALILKGSDYPTVLAASSKLEEVLKNWRSLPRKNKERDSFRDKEMETFLDREMESLSQLKDHAIILNRAYDFDSNVDIVDLFRNADIRATSRLEILTEQLLLVDPSREKLAILVEKLSFLDSKNLESDQAQLLLMRNVAGAILLGLDPSEICSAFIRLSCEGMTRELKCFSSDKLEHIELAKSIYKKACVTNRDIAIGALLAMCQFKTNSDVIELVGEIIPTNPDYIFVPMTKLAWSTLTEDEQGALVEVLLNTPSDNTDVTAYVGGMLALQLEEDLSSIMMQQFLETLGGPAYEIAAIRKLAGEEASLKELKLIAEASVVCAERAIKCSWSTPAYAASTPELNSPINSISLTENLNLAMAPSCDYSGRPYSYDDTALFDLLEQVKTNLSTDLDKAIKQSIQILRSLPDKKFLFALLDVLNHLSTDSVSSWGRCEVSQVVSIVEVAAAMALEFELEASELRLVLSCDDSSNVERAATRLLALDPTQDDLDLIRNDKSVLYKYSWPFPLEGQ